MFWAGSGRVRGRGLPARATTSSDESRVFIPKCRRRTLYGVLGKHLGKVHAWKFLSLACRGRLLMLHEGMCLMTAHTRLAFHEWIRLQLCHLVGVTGVACA